LINTGDRAELATEEYIPVAKNTIMEDIVILKKNPKWLAEQEAQAK